MRYAVVADLHGKRGAWRRVTAAAAAAGAEKILCLGDYLESEVPRRHHDPSRRWALDEVVERDPWLWDQLADADLVLGNQEIRIRELVAAADVPRRLARLLAAPERRHIGDALALHGHQVPWFLADGVFFPTWDDLPDVPVILAGHTHQTLLLEFATRTEARRRPVVPGRPVPLRSGTRLFANVGPARGKPSHWLLYDTDRAEITFHETAPGQKSRRDRH